MGFLIASLIIGAISTTFGIVNTQIQAERQKEDAMRQAEAQAESLRAQEEAEAQNQLQKSLQARREATRKRAIAEAGYAKSGVQLTGTPTLALANSVAENELETLMEESASGYKRKLLLNEAENTLIAGRNQASSISSAALGQSLGIGLSGASQLLATGYAMSDYNGSSSKSSSKSSEG